MAVKGSGTVARSNNPDPAMEDRSASTAFGGRNGAAKKTQTSFPDKWGMKDMNKESGVTSGIDPNSGAWANPPDASSPNPLDTEPKSKDLKKQAAILTSSWGMTDANGRGVDPNIGGKVLGEAILSGASSIPASTSTKTDSGKAPSPWPSEDKGG